MVNLLSNKNALMGLSELGLNNYESKVYLALISEGESTAKNLSNITSIPYGKIYEIINMLESKGFLSICPTKPMKCIAVSPRQSIELHKKRYHERINKFEATILRELEPLFDENRRSIEDKQPILVLKGRKNVNDKTESLIKNAKRQIYIITSENGLKRLGFYKELLEEANKRKVKVMIAGNITKNNLDDVKNLGFCELKHVNDVSCHLLSVDGKKGMIVESNPDDEDFLYGRDIAAFIPHPCFINLLNFTFTTKFSRAQTLDRRLDKIENS